MSNDHPIERLLRPIAEYNAATVSGVAAGLSVTAPYYWMMTEPVSYACASAFSYIGYKYLDDALRLSKYQRNIKTLKPVPSPPDLSNTRSSRLLSRCQPINASEGWDGVCAMLASPHLVVSLSSW